MKILIIEKQEALRKVLQDKLQISGFETLAFGNGDEAWKTAKIEKPDAILFDLTLFKSKDSDFFGTLKRDSCLKDVPVFILVDFGEDETSEIVLQMGVADCFIRTECPLGEVVEKVRKRLQPS